MAMTKQEKLLKLWLIRKLKSQGYLTYAKILREFDVQLLSENSSAVAYLDPAKGLFAMHPTLDDNQVSVIIRHEILHAYLQHEKRLLDKLAKEHGLNPNELDDLSIKKLKQELYSDKLFNIAGDYEISNKGYTDKDKDIIRNLIFNGRVVSGLITEDEHPDWVDMSIEEMFDELRKQKQQDKNSGDENKIVLGALQDETTFVDIEGHVYGV